MATDRAELLQVMEKDSIPPHTWPGGYPVHAIAADGGTFCPDCANGKNGSRCCEQLDPDCPDDKQWNLVAVDINWEDDDMMCAHCGKKLEPVHERE